MNTESSCNVQDWRLFHDLDSIAPEREKARANAEAQRQQRHAALEKENASIQAELPNIKGLFSGGKRRELEARLAQIEKELSAL